MIIKEEGIDIGIESFDFDKGHTAPDPTPTNQEPAILSLPEEGSEVDMAENDEDEGEATLNKTMGKKKKLLLVIFAASVAAVVAMAIGMGVVASRNNASAAATYADFNAAEEDECEEAGVITASKSSKGKTMAPSQATAIATPTVSIYAPCVLSVNVWLVSLLTAHTSLLCSNMILNLPCLPLPRLLKQTKERLTKIPIPYPTQMIY